jgi:hypothetical protein
MSTNQWSCRRVDRGFSYKFIEARYSFGSQLTFSGDKIMGIWQWVKEVTVKIFWPWFKEFAWPFIQQHMKDLIFFVLDLFKEKFKTWVSEQAKKKTDNANRKAEEFEQKAKSSQKDEEADKFRTVAQVWREVAEQYRQENESLRNKIDGLSEEVKDEAFAKADSLKIDLDFSDEKPILSIGDAVHKLPQLPAGDNKEKG